MQSAKDELVTLQVLMLGQIIPDGWSLLVQVNELLWERLLFNTPSPSITGASSDSGISGAGVSPSPDLSSSLLSLDPLPLRLSKPSSSCDGRPHKGSIILTSFSLEGSFLGSNLSFQLNQIEQKCFGKVWMGKSFILNTRIRFELEENLG